MARARRCPGRSRPTQSISAAGWAQVNGRTTLPWSERIELDIWYVEHRSLRLDLRILAMTVRMVLGGHGLYHPDPTGGVDLGSTDLPPAGPGGTGVGSTGRADSGE